MMKDFEFKQSGLSPAETVAYDTLLQFPLGTMGYMHASALVADPDGMLYVNAEERVYYQVVEWTLNNSLTVMVIGDGVLVDRFFASKQTKIARRRTEDGRFGFSVLRAMFATVDEMLEVLENA